MNAYDLVCSKCLTHEDFFKTDKDTLVNRCPKCGGTNHTRYVNLGWTKRDLADDLKDKWERKEVRRYIWQTSIIGYIVMAIALAILFYYR